MSVSSYWSQTQTTQCTHISSNDVNALLGVHPKSISPQTSMTVENLKGDQTENSKSGKLTMKHDDSSTIHPESSLWNETTVDPSFNETATKYTHNASDNIGSYLKLESSQISNFSKTKPNINTNHSYNIPERKSVTLQTAEKEDKKLFLIIEDPIDMDDENDGITKFHGSKMIKEGYMKKQGKLFKSWMQR